MQRSRDGGRAHLVRSWEINAERNGPFLHLYGKPYKAVEGPNPLYALSLTATKCDTFKAYYFATVYHWISRNSGFEPQNRRDQKSKTGV